MSSLMEKIGEIGIIPVIKIDEAEKAVPLARALAAGGIPCAEITFRTAAGEEAIRRVNDAGLDVLLGAGTVLTVEQVDKAVSAGAKFIVSPGFNPKVVARCIEKGVPVMPGCASPTDIEQALEFGLDVVKLFPAELLGGLDYIKAVAAPYTAVKFVPTGGINAANIAKYLAYEKIVACGGSWMVRDDMLAAGDFDGITRLCREAVRSVLQFELGHVGINADNEADATRAAKMFETLFGFEAMPGKASVFAGTYVEVMKPPFRGKNGHIGIATGSVARARAFLERQGFRFLPESAKTDAGGNLTLIYLEDEIAGFAVHLMQKNNPRTKGGINKWTR